MVGGLRDVITCTEFQIEIFMGYDFTGGRIFDFPIDFSMGLTTVQRYCAACDSFSFATCQVFTYIILLYATEACPMLSRDKHSLEFTTTRLFMNIFALAPLESLNVNVILIFYQSS